MRRPRDAESGLAEMGPCRKARLCVGNCPPQCEGPEQRPSVDTVSTGHVPPALRLVLWWGQLRWLLGIHSTPARKAGLPLGL